MTAPPEDRDGLPLEVPAAPDGAGNADGPRTSRNGWMVTFADVLALLLTFFVMMFAMNDIREDEWKGFVQAMTGRFNPANPPADFQMRDGISDTSAVERLGLDLGYLESLIQTHLDSADTAGDYQIMRRSDRLIIRLPSVLAIEDGQPTLTRTARSAAREIGQVLGTLDNRVSVDGHAARGTDGVLYPSAWELSLAAATVVADAIRETGFEREIRVFGRGDAHLGTGISDAGTAETAGEVSGPSWGRVDVVVREAQAQRRNDEN